MAGRHLERFIGDDYPLEADAEDVGVHIGERSFPVVGLMPFKEDRDGRSIEGGNLLDKIGQFGELIRIHPDLKKILRDGCSGRKKMTVVLSLGVLSLIIGTELGVRHGMDIKRFADFLSGKVQRSVTKEKSTK